MQLSKYITMGILSSFFYSSAALSNYASKDYVDNRIHVATSSLLTQINTAINTLLTQLIDTTNNLNNKIDEARITPHVIGEIYQGGIIFFVDDTRLHGLIAAKHDANDGQGVQWKNGETGEKVTNARANGLGAGAGNTRIIISAQTIDRQSGNFAALTTTNYSISSDGDTPCTTDANLSMNCYGDWYLPSIYELDLMRLNIGQQGGFAIAPYWSSTESGVSQAWLEDMQTGVQSMSDKANSSALVRAIRSF